MVLDKVELHDDFNVHDVEVLEQYIRRPKRMFTKPTGRAMCNLIDKAVTCWISLLDAWLSVEGYADETELHRGECAASSDDTEDPRGIFVALWRKHLRDIPKSSRMKRESTKKSLQDITTQLSYGFDFEIHT